MTKLEAFRHNLEQIRRQPLWDHKNYRELTLICFEYIVVDQCGSARNDLVSGAVLSEAQFRRYPELFFTIVFVVLHSTVQCISLYRTVDRNTGTGND